MESTSGELQTGKKAKPESVLRFPTKKIGRSRHNCYRMIKIIGQGTFGRVFMAETLKHQTVAIKSVLNDERYKCREVEIQLGLNHPNIVRILDHYTLEKGNEQYAQIVMEYLPESLLAHFRLCRKQNDCMSQLLRKIYIFQLFKAFAHLHKKKVCHRDLKPANILINPQTCQLKVCDFGSAKIIMPNENNLFYMCSRYYRPPQLLLGYSNYGNQIDIWSIGCIMIEFYIFEPVFPGESSLEQMIEIIKILGTPPAEFMDLYCKLESKLNLPFIKSQPWKRVLRKCKAEPVFVDLLQKALTYDVKNRIKAQKALFHPYFSDLTKPQNYDAVSNVPHLFEFLQEAWGEMNAEQEAIADKFRQVRSKIESSKKKGHCHNSSSTTNQG